MKDILIVVWKMLSEGQVTYIYMIDMKNMMIHRYDRSWGCTRIVVFICKDASHISAYFYRYVGHQSVTSSSHEWFQVSDCIGYRMMIKVMMVMMMMMMVMMMMVMIMMVMVTVTVMMMRVIMMRGEVEDEDD